MEFKTNSFNTFNELYYQLCKHLIFFPGNVVKNKDGKTIHELINVNLVLRNPRDRILTLKKRNLSLYYLAGELSWYLTGCDKIDVIAHYANLWNHLDDGNGTANSCYGKKLLYDTNGYALTQFDFAFKQLIKNRTTKKAVMVVYDKDNANLRTKDLPCTMSLQFFIRNNKLHLLTHMRSNDIWYGLSYDLPFFTIIQEMMLVRLNNELPNNEQLELGAYCHSAGSMHLYERHFAQGRELGNSCTCDVFDYKSTMPQITMDSMNQLAELKLVEEMLRCTNRRFKSNLTDPFLLKIVNWLKKEEALK